MIYVCSTASRKQRDGTLGRKTTVYNCSDVDIPRSTKMTDAVTGSTVREEEIMGG
jgi:hypothetical protein